VFRPFSGAHREAIARMFGLGVLCLYNPGLNQPALDVADFQKLSAGRFARLD
jgi:hypothetical protein